VMKFSNASDESLIAFYESVRRQVRADMQWALSLRRRVNKAIRRHPLRRNGPTTNQICAD
jgi:hypothetical protein